MKKLALALILSFGLMLAASAVFACPADCPNKTQGADCPNKDKAAACTPQGYDQPLKVGDKYKCGCAMEQTVTDKTEHVAFEGKHYYFCNAECANKFKEAHKK